MWKLPSPQVEAPPAGSIPYQTTVCVGIFHVSSGNKIPRSHSIESWLVKIGIPNWIMKSSPIYSKASFIHHQLIINQLIGSVSRSHISCLLWKQLEFGMGMRPMEIYADRALVVAHVDAWRFLMVEIHKEAARRGNKKMERSQGMKLMKPRKIS